jgi:hypothetical protein
MRAGTAFTNPETARMADGLPNSPCTLVGFAQPDVWLRYRGRSTDRVYVDVRALARGGAMSDHDHDHPHAPVSGDEPAAAAACAGSRSCSSSTGS